MHCRVLGTSVRPGCSEGRSGTGRVGELWRSASGTTRTGGFREACFDTYPGISRHGGWSTIASGGTAIVHGRSGLAVNGLGVGMSGVGMGGVGMGGVFAGVSSE
jgi:hypothetical protein